ncbi:MAG: heme-binding domain-containing protein [Blastocatellia bacterium]|nr:heme-binding domain-containing protein [Blastocatellia bacterium]
MLKKILKIAAIVIVAALIVVQFIRPDFTNPPVNEAETLEASVQVPENIKAIMNRSCSDCHTNTTVYPWYSQISPVSWWLKNHIDEGRRELNFSVWATYQPKRKAKKLEEVCEQINEKEMPLPSYTWAHRDAILSAEESKVLCDWATAEKAKIEIPPA